MSSGLWVIQEDTPGRQDSEDPGRWNGPLVAFDRRLMVV